MIQHLLNTTAIWLLCLLAFDLFLRKETFHAYNRFFLLVTFVVGLLLPFWEWGADSVVFSDTFRAPVASVVNAKQSIEVASTTSVEWDWQAYAGIVYLGGVAVALFLLLVDIFKVVRLYRKGIKSSDGSWTIIKTSGNHGPFSVFNLLFVDSKERYTEDEWNLILAHEQQHRNRLHFFDLLLMQVVRVLLWFHPLVYLYHRRLLMVHEYEADSAVRTALKEYGRFLIEQALLGNAPAITHSFNRSPIKKRITMLTRNSNSLKKVKLFIGLPVMLASILFFTQCTNSHENSVEGNIITYNGNKIELSEPRIDTIEVIDPVTGETKRMFERADPEPVKYNGEKIFSMRTLDSEPEMKSGGYQQYLIDKLGEPMGMLPDGTYYVLITNLILDDKGKIVYYEFKGISRLPEESLSAAQAQQEIPDDVHESIKKAVSDAMANMPIAPGKKGGAPVITHLYNLEYKYSKSVKIG